MSDNIIEQIQTKPEFIEKVKKWVVMDSQLKIVNEKTKQLREMKSQLNHQICDFMNNHNLAQNRITISDGELRLHEKKEYSTITFGYIQRCLADLIKDDTQVEFIIQYLKDNREVTTSSDIKRTYKKSCDV
tara:strand:+ start:151 stop:543 length:393 start_codon:yes stop_codon:yes gene_type:complete